MGDSDGGSVQPYAYFFSNSGASSGFSTSVSALLGGVPAGVIFFNDTLLERTREDITVMVVGIDGQWEI